MEAQAHLIDELVEVWLKYSHDLRKIRMGRGGGDKKEQERKIIKNEYKWTNENRGIKT